ncbi:DUF29 domain-containing protein [Trichothermofontia sichuanensis B231]|uniref:DUF29 domain-containing protein n=1 Tax=Trichothermofontia sichuanensis TaxID=3045816 RepID=UPI00224552E0|nr:DUF29 domain-containing protein [Trichothermofontia sichuanensis]UZQ53828.1 DUF29 domain-containing protein [Trichothermofontia sichuanensis B231]
MTQSLYEQDILLWAEDTVAKLKARDFEHLDLEHLIEEVESLGISQRKELLTRLTRLLEHLLKRLYVPSPEDYRGWENTIREQRRQLRFLLEAAPSLKRLWAVSFDRAWQAAYEDMSDAYPQIPFPSIWPYEGEIEVVLTANFWEREPPSHEGH